MEDYQLDITAVLNEALENQQQPEEPMYKIPVSVPRSEIKWCGKGHPLWVEGGRNINGKCAICWREYNARYNRERKAGIRVPKPRNK